MSLAQGVAVSGRAAQPKRPLPPGVTPPKIDFRDIAKGAGLSGVNVSGDAKNKVYIVESTGTGIVVLDYDRDGFQDILFVNADYLDRRKPRPRHYLYHNQGDLKFEDVTAKAGIWV